MATIKEIANRLQISSATVSMALNNRAGVNPDTKKKVLNLAEELGYTKSLSRRMNSLTGMLGIVVYKKHGHVVADTQFFSELIQAIEHSARLLGFGISIIYCSGDNDLHRILEKWQGAPPNAALFLATEMTDGSLLESIKIPTMLLDCNLRDFSSDKVLIDNEDGILKALRYLYEKGHREIGYFHSMYSIRNFEERGQAYRSGLADLGIPIREENIFLVPPSTEEAFDATYEMLKNGRKLPGACITDNDLIACGALKAIKKFGLSIPKDVSLIGFDDVPIAALVDPELTSIRVSREALGGLAVKQLIRRIEKGDAPFTKILVSTQLIERNSVRDIR
jgi:DNA-binding LacI/PurR family transcriptional regulator